MTTLLGGFRVQMRPSQCEPDCGSPTGLVLGAQCSHRSALSVCYRALLIGALVRESILSKNWPSRF